MGRPYQILLPLLSLFLVRVDLTDLFPLKYEVKIIKVVDGDTLHVLQGKRILKVRLSKLDSPEKGQPFVGSSADAGDFALRCAKAAIKNHGRLILRIEKQDIYGRLLGDIEGLSLKLIESGCSGLYPYAGFSSRHEKSIYLQAYAKARSGRVGLWNEGGYQLPKAWRKSHQHFRKRIAVQQ